MRLRSSACDTQVIVVKAPTEPIELRCAGHPMLSLESPAAELVRVEGFDTGAMLGKRYSDDASGLVVLVTQAGIGTLSVGTAPLATLEAKVLPSSD